VGPGIGSGKKATFGGLNLSGTGSINLTAASSGPYAGIAYFQSRDNTAADLVSGNAVLNLNDGVFYSSAAQLNLSGNASVFNATEVVNELLMSGKALDQ